jgi:hypothetical protein
VANSIYFFLLPAQISRDNYAHNALVLAEGLRELGWNIYANIDYWRDSPDGKSFLFRYDSDVHPSDCAVNVLTYDWMHFINVVPFELEENTRSIRVYLEDAGWLSTPGLSGRFAFFDLILKSHFNERTRYPTNFRPWSFGVSNRILRQSEDSLPTAQRDRRLLVNFGATHDYRHELRSLFDCKVYPRLGRLLTIDRTTNRRTEPPTDPYHRFMWEQTAGRHYPDYYERLRTSAVCSCVGGQLMPSAPADWAVFAGRGKRVEIRKAGYELATSLKCRVRRWNQWESWRFWESLAAGCVSLMLDFEKYGVHLPVQPRNWEHYVGLDLDRLDRDCERLMEEPALLQKISEAGRLWALANYTSTTTARRFTSIIDA